MTLQIFLSMTDYPTCGRRDGHSLFVLASFLVVALAACGARPPGSPNAATGSGQPLEKNTQDRPPIQTTSPRYAILRAQPPQAGELTIIARYSNPTRGRIFLAECEDDDLWVDLQKQVDGQWIDAFESQCPAVRRNELPSIGPGETRTDTLRFRHYPGGYPRFTVAQLAGRFRLVYRAYSSWPPTGAGEAVPLPPGSRISNEFEVRDAR